MARATHLDLTVRTLVRIKPHRNTGQNSSVMGSFHLDNILNVSESTSTKGSIFCRIVILSHEYQSCQTKERKKTHVNDKRHEVEEKSKDKGTVLTSRALVWFGG